VAFFVVCVEIMKFGFGRHLWEVTGLQMANYLDVCVWSLLSQDAANSVILESHCYGHNLHLGSSTHKDLLPHSVSPLSRAPPYGFRGILLRGFLGHDLIARLGSID
jgi:hypothetical protein